MKELGMLFTDKIHAIICEENLVRRYTCEGCGEEVSVRKVEMPFGPAKGQVKELTKGCRCEDIMLGRRAVQKTAENKKKKLFRLFDQKSLINQDLKNCTLDSYIPYDPTQKSAKQESHKYADTFSYGTSGNLLYSGNTGVGKSHLASSTLKAMMEKGHTGLFISVPKLLTKLKSTFHKNSEHTESDLLSVLEEVDCLVLDDIGSEYGTEKSGSWGIHKIFEIIDNRLGKHTIYTTNLTGRELRSKIGERNFSRLLHETKVIKITGNDYRTRDSKTINGNNSDYLSDYDRRWRDD